jgi:hypothetical protein
MGRWPDAAKALVLMLDNVKDPLGGVHLLILLRCTIRVLEWQTVGNAPRRQTLLEQAAGSFRRCQNHCSDGPLALSATLENDRVSPILNQP